MTIGQRIKELRGQKGWSQKELVAKLAKFGKIGRSTISSWEIGANGPNPTQRENLCKVFEITEAELFGGAPSKIRPEILEALDDPIAVKVFLTAHKNSEDIKNAIKILLETLPNLTPKKRQAVLDLCR